MKSRENDSEYRVEILTPDHHISDFVSSDDDLTEYLLNDALDDGQYKTAITHLLIDSHDFVAGYFTLLNDSIRVEIIDKRDLIDGYEYRSLPALKIGRLSTHKDLERKGLGTLMLTISVSYVFEINNYSGCRIVTVDSKIGCEEFYEGFGFKRVDLKRDNFTPLYLDIGPALKQLGHESKSP